VFASQREEEAQTDKAGWVLQDMSQKIIREVLQQHGSLAG
jgi:hypothetical protein